MYVCDCRIHSLSIKGIRDLWQAEGSEIVGLIVSYRSHPHSAPPDRHELPVPPSRYVRRDRPLEERCLGAPHDTYVSFVPT